MKRPIYFIAYSLLAMAAPLAAFAGTWTPPTQTAPGGNVEGPVWLQTGAPVSQTGNFSVSGNGTVNRIEANDVSFAGRFNGDIKVADGKAFRIDKDFGSSILNIGNWGNLPTGFTLGVYGNMNMFPFPGIPPSPPILTMNGTSRLNVYEICLTADTCRTTWPAGGGAGTVTSISQGTGITATPNPIVGAGTIALDTGYTDGRYVNVIGDTMTGSLTLLGPGLTVSTPILDVSSDMRFQRTGQVMQSGGYMTPVDNAFLEIRDPANIRKVKFLTATLGDNAGANGLQIRTNKDLSPSVNSAYFDSSWGGQVHTSVVMNPSTAGALLFDAKSPGTINTRVSGYIGYCPDVLGECRGLDVTANGASGLGVGAQFSHTNGSSARLADGDYGARLVGKSFGLSARGETYGAHAENTLTPTNFADLGTGSAGVYAYGSGYGVLSLNSTPGVGIGVSGSGGAIGGQFTGTLNGVVANASAGLGGSFTGALLGAKTVTTGPGAAMQAQSESSAGWSAIDFLNYTGALAAFVGWGNTAVGNYPNMAYFGTSQLFPTTLITNGARRVTIDANGLVGIGTTAPTALLSVNGAANKPGGGMWDVFSDARLKVIDGEFTRGLSSILDLQPVTYRYKEGNALNLPTDRAYIGLTAQAVERAIPEAVKVGKDGYLIIESDPIIWTMLNAIKELKAENDALKARVEALEAR